MAFFDLAFYDATPGRPGWLEIRLKGDDGAPRILVKVEERNGRVAIARLIIDGDVSSQTLREIPLGRVEALLNSQFAGSDQTYADVLISPKASIPAEQLERLKEQHKLFPDEFEQIDKALDRYLDLTVKGPRVPLTVKGPREPLTRPDGTDPDGFSRRAAEAYNALVVTTSAPAKALADEVGVPVGTVHRWIREARQRGHLPPARKGRAG